MNSKDILLSQDFNYYVIKDGRFKHTVASSGAKYEENIFFVFFFFVCVLFDLGSEIARPVNVRR